MLKVTNYGHACFKFSSENLSLLFDPYDDVPNLQMPMVHANYCKCSHSHSDHNATQYVELIPTEARLNIEALDVPHDHHEGAQDVQKLQDLFKKSALVLRYRLFPDKSILVRAGFDLCPVNENCLSGDFSQIKELRGDF